MSLHVIGINQRTAPVDIREKVVFAGEELPEALRELKAVAGVRESLIVSIATARSCTASVRTAIGRWSSG